MQGLRFMSLARWRLWGGVAAAIASSALGFAGHARAAAPLYYGVSFADAQRGAVMVDRCSKHVCRSELLLTNDGGHSWRKPRVPGRAEALWGKQAGQGVVFASRHYRLDRSVDAGTTWTSVPLPGAVLSWDARSTGAWAITKPCRRLHLCEPRLWHSPDAGRTWYFTTLRDASRSTTLKSEFDMSFADAADGAVLYMRRDESYALALTADGGHSWSMGRAPCSGEYSQSATIAWGPGGALWVGCATGRGTGDQGHQIFVSSDGGRHFAERIRAPFAQHAVLGHGLDGYGYLSGISACSSRSAVVELYRGGLFRTDDGGRSWRQLRGIPFGDGAEFAGTALLSDCTHLWEALWSTGLFESSDGGRHWAEVR